MDGRRGEGEGREEEDDAWREGREAKVLSLPVVSVK